MAKLIKHHFQGGAPLQVARSSISNPNSWHPNWPPLNRNLFSLVRSPPPPFLSFPFWETQQGHVRSEDQTSHLQLAPPALRTCDKPEGAERSETEPLEEGVGRFVRGGGR